MLPLAWVRFQIACVRIVARIFQLNILCYVQWTPRTLTLGAYHVTQNDIMLALVFVCTLYVERASREQLRFPLRL